jgi:hypothetical protein
VKADSNRKAAELRPELQGRLAAYLAAVVAVGAGAGAAPEAQAAVVGSNTVQPFGVNGVVGIDFNSDGQTDFQIDHDRVTLPSSAVLDYLQIDKNDINGEGNPLAFDPGPNTTFQATPFQDGATPRNDANNAAYVISGSQGSYPAALALGTEIGPTSTFDFQELDNFQGSGKWIRANRLIDEDATQIDQVLGGQPPSGVQVPFNGPNFDGLGGEVRYVGVKMELNDSGLTNYGWIGLRITNEADATGEVVGWAYETLPNVPIDAGLGLAVPEPSSAAILVVSAGLLYTRGCRKREIGR